MKVTYNIEIYNESCFDRIALTDSGSIDIICIDPPYLYLKHKLDAAFDEELFFNECKRILTKNGFIIVFGRGASFYRWGSMLDRLDFTFKEEIIWDKSQCSSPLMALSRVHETVSIWTKGKGTINKCKIPYLEMKGNDIDSICGDIKRMRSILKNTKSLNAVLEFLENNTRDTSEKWDANQLSISSVITKEDRSVSAIRSISEGLNEKTIIRTDRLEQEKFTKHSVNTDKREKGDRAADVIQGISFGLNEKSIIHQKQGVTISSDKVGKVPDSVVDMNKIVNGMSEKSIITTDAFTFLKSYYYELLELLQQNGQTTIYEELRNHYGSIHPTEKPVRLLERLIQLVIPKDKATNKVIVADWFGGSYSTMKAVHNLGLRGVSTEILKEYHLSGMESLKDHCKQLNLFAS